MRLSAPSVLVATLLLSGARPTRHEPMAVSPNPNTDRAGTLRGGVLAVALEAKQSTWLPNGSAHPAVPIEAFSEEGDAERPLVPGPLLRVAQGGDVHLSVRNSLASPLTFMVPSAIRGAGAGWDSIVVAPGAQGVMSVRAVLAGNYAYRAMTASTPRQEFVTGHLAGAIVVDSAGAPKTSSDRVFVVSQALAPIPVAKAASATRGQQLRAVFLINGLSWPHTEKIAATMGDSLHWRIINASAEIHPMHLHGFYFRVDGYSPPTSDRTIRGAPGRLEVTERMPQFTGMLMTWSPDRPGNWIFHCHAALHVIPDEFVEDHVDHDAIGNHAMTGMGGLVLGVTVSSRKGVQLAGTATPKRHLRLVAVVDSAPTPNVRPLRFILEENGRRTESNVGISPTIELVRGEPVSVMIVNHLGNQPTGVHWHGIELESYNDGVAGWSGSGTKLEPMIAPNDSFEVRFTPPRAGTFMYHSHMHELLQQTGGLSGALIVRDRTTPRAVDDHTFMLKGSLALTPDRPLDVNGATNPDTLVLHVGMPARLRFMSLAVFNPNATVSLTARPDSSYANVRDTLIVRWKPLAKDGADLPEVERAARAARQIVSIGETFDFEYTPDRRGNLRIEVRGWGDNGSLLARIPVRVE